MFDKNENGLIQLSNFSFDNGEISFSFSIKSGNEDESFLSGKALASVFGALAETGIDDFIITRASEADGSSPGDSKSHVNGINFDSRFLRTDKSGGALDIESDFDRLDVGRQKSLNSALNRFGFKDLRASEVSNGENSILKVPGTRNIDNHYDHLHAQDYKPSILTVKRPKPVRPVLPLPINFKK